MTVELTVALALLLLCGLAAPAFAESLPFESTFAIEGLGPLAPVATATGTATVNGSGPPGHLTSLSVPSNLLSIMTTITPTPNPTSPPPFSALIVTMNNTTGTFSGSEPGTTFGGEMAVPGNIRVCLLFSCGSFFDIPLTSFGTRGVGLSGPAIVRGGAVAVTVQGAPWTTGPVVITTPSGTVNGIGFAHGPASGTSSTGQPGGVVKLVTPVTIMTKSLLSPPSQLFMIPSFQVEFIPEPGALALLLPGIGTLLALGAIRLRRDRRR